MTRQADKRFLRLRLAEAQNWRCAYCGRVMEMDGPGPSTATADHLALRSRGGRRNWWNTIAACRACNEARGAEPCFVGFFFLMQPTERRRSDGRSSSAN